MSGTHDLDPQGLARALGLDRLANDYPDDVARAAAFAKSLAESLPRDLSAAEEPAHVFRADIPGANPDPAS
jgi:hypothetical protein